MNALMGGTGRVNQGENLSWRVRSQTLPIIVASASSVVMHAQDVVTVVLLCTANLHLDLAWVIDYSLTQKSCDGQCVLSMDLS